MTLRPVRETFLFGTGLSFEYADDDDETDTGKGL
jgi:hypothetical protein